MAEKKRITTFIDEDVLHWLQERGKAYQTLLNRTLREAMARDEIRQEALRRDESALAYLSGRFQREGSLDGESCAALGRLVRAAYRRAAEGDRGNAPVDRDRLMVVLRAVGNLAMERDHSPRRDRHEEYYLAHLPPAGGHGDRREAVGTLGEAIGRGLERVRSGAVAAGEAERYAGVLAHLLDYETFDRSNYTLEQILRPDLPALLEIAHGRVFPDA